MRRAAALPVVLPLLLAFLMAPYQHVHLAANHREDAHHDHDHDDAVVVHIHFYGVAAPVAQNGGVNLEDSDADHVSRSLDTFTTRPQARFLAFVRPESRPLLFPPANLFVGAVDATEPCGHDPPLLDFPTPRGPPA